MDDDEAESDADNNDQAPEDPVVRQDPPREPRGGQGSEGPQGPMGLVAIHFMNLHVKCPIFSTKNDKDVDSHLLHSNIWMN